jgi:hypothetical protein
MRFYKILSSMLVCSIFFFLAKSNFAQDQSVIIYNQQRLFVGDVDLANQYLKSILGKWDDGKGTTIEFFIENIDSKKHSADLVRHSKVFNYNAVISAKTTTYLKPYCFENETSCPFYGHCSVKQSQYKVPVGHVNTIASGKIKFDLVQTSHPKVSFSFSKVFEAQKEHNAGDDCGEISEPYWILYYPLPQDKYNPVPQIRIGGDLYFNLSTHKLYGSAGGFCYYPYKPESLFWSGKNELDFTVKLKAISSEKELNPDGESTLQIQAQLYSYIPGDNASSKPVSGKTLTFSIQEMDGIKPGSLSSSTAVTDANGMASITYTAPTTEVLDKMREFARNNVAITIRDNSSGAEDVAYINFKTDNGKVWVNPSPGILSDHGYVPPHKDFPATINIQLEGKREPNTEVTFTIKEDNPLGLLRSADGREGKEIKVKANSEGIAEAAYFYAAANPPEKKVTETVEVRTNNMTIPLTAKVSTAFNIVLADAVSGYEGAGEINAGEEIPLKITVKDEWNPDLDLEEMLTYWGLEDVSSGKRLNVKLEIKKQGFVPNYMLDMMGEQNYPEPLYEELLVPKSFEEVKNLLYIPEYSLKKKGYPVVKPRFSGNNNYEIHVSLVDQKGNTVFESANPRKTAYLSIPTGLAADAFSIWFVSNPFGPHTPEARFFRTVLSTVSIGEYGGFGAIISLADAASAINQGDADALVNVMLSEIKSKVLSDVAEGKGLTAERVELYNNMAMAEQYVSFALTGETDQGLIAQMESKLLTGIADLGKREDYKMVVLKGNGAQQLFVRDESSSSNKFKDKIGIKITGVDEKTEEMIDKVGKKIKGKGKEVPVEEGKYIYDDKLNTISLKNGNVSIYMIPSEFEISCENAQMSSY